MATKTLLSPRITVFALLFFTFAGNAYAASERVIHTFLGSPDGLNPDGALVADHAGNLYGTTTMGGANSVCNCGTVFELSPPANPGGEWSETILYSFNGVDDGGDPFGTLIFDKLGNLYGVAGGVADNALVFELSPPVQQGENWTEKAIFTFPTRNDALAGNFPDGKLAMDEAGNIYGTTWGGGVGHTHCAWLQYRCGIVFELSPPTDAGGRWTEEVLYDFGTQTGYGAHPGNLMYRAGVLYGLTDFGGAHCGREFGCGTVFRLARENGKWVASSLHSFSVDSGASPQALIAGDDGNLYGTLAGGGIVGSKLGRGVVFKLSPPAVAGRPWLETKLCVFQGGSDGVWPSTVIRGEAGDVYGTTFFRYVDDNEQLRAPGLVFKLSASEAAGTAWTEDVVYAFAGGESGDAAQPSTNMIWVNGALYGTTFQGGINNGGVVYSVVP